MRNIVKSLFVLSICGILLTWHFNSDSILPPEENQELELEIVETHYSHEDEEYDEELSSALLIGGAVILLGPMIVIPGVLYVWASSLAVDQPEPGTLNSYITDDAAASTSAADDDTLMVMRWSYAEDDLNWAFVVMRLRVGDYTYDCGTGDWDDCSIGQDGSDDYLWETGEFLTISENGEDIASGGTTTIELYITYRGTAVAGDSSVTVA